MKSLRNILTRLFLKLVDKEILRNEFSQEVIQPYYIIGELKNVSFGKSVSFGGNVILHNAAPIDIGDNTMIGFGTIIHTTTHNPELQPAWSEWIKRPIRIGKDVWIGAGAIILPGVIIEDSAIVGSGSVVTKNVPKGAVVVGSPARIVRFRDNEVIEKKYVSEKIEVKPIDLGFLTEYLTK